MRLHRAEVRRKEEKPKRGELIRFVGQQFKELIRKNLEVPVKLYHL